MTVIAPTAPPQGPDHASKTQSASNDDAVIGWALTVTGPALPRPPARRVRDRDRSRVWQRSGCHGRVGESGFEIGHFAVLEAQVGARGL